MACLISEWLLFKKNDVSQFINEDFLDDSEEDVDISVHCDLKIFEWLIDYITSPIDQRPKLGTKELISILISSQFLGMDNLVKECIRFFKNNANDIICLPIDLSCINEPLIDELSEYFSPEDIDHLIDPKRKVNHQNISFMSEH